MEVKCVCEVCENDPDDIMSNKATWSTGTSRDLHSRPVLRDQRSSATTKPLSCRWEVTPNGYVIARLTTGENKQEFRSHDFCSGAPSFMHLSWPLLKSLLSSSTRRRSPNRNLPKKFVKILVLSVTACQCHLVCNDLRKLGRYIPPRHLLATS